jgi:FkbM family methyltransferase
MLAEIAREVFTKYPGATAIDIGANVGDSAALINAHADVPVLCIEGCGDFAGYLRRNARLMGGRIRVEETFVASAHDREAALSGGRKGTLSLVAGGGGGKRVRLSPLRDILRGHPDFAASKLLKIDTDGMDFGILLEALDVLGRLAPVILYEYDIVLSRDGERMGMESARGLMSIGYAAFIAFDNYGNYLFSFDDLEGFLDINACLRSNVRNGRAIHYMDICAFHERDRDLFRRLCAYYRGGEDQRGCS